MSEPRGKTSVETALDEALLRDDDDEFRHDPHFHQLSAEEQIALLPAVRQT